MLFVGWFGLLRASMNPTGWRGMHSALSIREVDEAYSKSVYLL